MEGSYSIVVDGESFEVVVRDLGRHASERRFQVMVGGREHEVFVKLETEEKAAPKLDLGSVKNLEPPRSAPRKTEPAGKKAEGQALGKVVGAPMTGKIVSIHVVEGQKVAEGDLLVVLEAMKMENSILASAGGLVSGISVGVGDNVRKGEKICALLATS